MNNVYYNKIDGSEIEIIKQSEGELDLFVKDVESDFEYWTTKNDVISKDSVNQVKDALRFMFDNGMLQISTDIEKGYGRDYIRTHVLIDNKIVYKTEEPIY